MFTSNNLYASKLKFPLIIFIFLVLSSLLSFNCKSNKKNNYYIKDESTADSIKVITAAATIDTSGIVAFSEGEYPDVKWGYKKDGKIFIAPQFAFAGEFSEGVAKILSNTRWGYIDKDARFVIKPAFGGASEFHSDKAIIYKDSSYYFINKKGEVLSGIFDDKNISAIPIPSAFKPAPDTGENSRTAIEQFAEKIIKTADSYRVDFLPDEEYYRSAEINILKHGAVLINEYWEDGAEFTLRIPGLSRAQAISYVKLMAAGKKYSLYDRDQKSEFNKYYPGEDVIIIDDNEMSEIYRIKEQKGAFKIIYYVGE